MHVPYKLAAGSSEASRLVGELGKSLLVISSPCSVVDSHYDDYCYYEDALFVPIQQQCWRWEEELLGRLMPIREQLPQQEEEYNSTNELARQTSRQYL